MGEKVNEWSALVGVKLKEIDLWDSLNEHDMGRTCSMHGGKR
jgi:hypothetical protein